MKSLKLFTLAAALSTCLLAAMPSTAKAQLNIVVQIGPEPGCPYGYFNYAPYSCAPFGYYGPQWFANGLFIGAGPWFHGPNGFRGYVNHSFDPHYGYRGPFPQRGERPDWDRHRGWEKSFRGNDAREEHWHDNGNHYGQYKDHDDHGNGHDNHDNGHGNSHDDHGNDHGNAHDNGHNDDHGHGHDDHH